MITNYPTRVELQECFELRVDERNGHETLWRKNNSSNNKWKNKGEWLQVKCKANRSDGYCSARFKGRIIKYHTIVWILVNGDILEGLMIDHISGDKDDNQLSNLRLVTNRDNGCNRIEHRGGKLYGCRLHKCGKWEAHIVINGKQIYLGSSLSELESHQVYLKALELINQFVDSNQFRKLLTN